jgi:hypothetical protein
MRPIRRNAPFDRAALAGRGVLSAGAVPLLDAIGAPWWAAALVAVMLMISTTTVGLAERMLPQDSRDRRDWWRDFWQHRDRRDITS